jgi:rsbT co-antagonist protein RsbR
MAQTKTRIPDILRKFEPEILQEWTQDLLKAGGRQKLLIKEQDLKTQCKEFLNLLVAALQNSPGADIQAAAWAPVRERIGEISESRVRQGFTPSETAVFIFSLKRPIFARLRKEIKTADALGEEVWALTEVLDNLGLFSTEVYQKAREEVIARQQDEMMELSTPVVKLWDGVLALPLIGTLDSARTQVVMEALLQRIVETGSTVAIIDITGVPTVDTLVAQHLIKTVTAARLMGAECIISGIRPQIAQTIVHLGVALGNVVTKSNLADAFQLALQRLGIGLARTGPPAPEQRSS